MPVIPIRSVRGTQEEELLKEGWSKQTTLDEPRLSEVVDNYRALGYEVHVEPFHDRGDGCTTCFDAGNKMGKICGTVYIRKRGGDPREDELF